MYAIDIIYLFCKQLGEPSSIQKDLKCEMRSLDNCLLLQVHQPP